MYQLVILALLSFSLSCRAEESVVVAVIDTGLDLSHPELQKNIWVNPGETGLDSRGCDKSNNGIDDDGNGFVDDVHGWNFAASNGDLTDRHGHGTHVSGIIKSVAPNVKFMVLKYIDPLQSRNGTLAATVKAIQYAIRMKARLINFSGGGLEPSRWEEEALREAEKKNIIVVAAAGNEGANMDKDGFFPAAYPLANIISVASVDDRGHLLSSSNYGRKTVHLAARGQEIRSTLPGGREGLMTGTSQATAFVSGTAALLLAAHPGLQEPLEIKKYLAAGGTSRVEYKNKMKYGVSLNQQRTLAMEDESVAVTGVVYGNSSRLPFHLFFDSSLEEKEMLP